MKKQPEHTTTADEWASTTLHEPLARILTQWPWLHAEVKGDGVGASLRVWSERFKGQLTLTLDDDDVWMPAVYIGSATTMAGPVSEARVHLREALDVCDALDTAAAMLRGVRVWWP